MASEEKGDIFVSGLVFKEETGWSSLCLEFDVSSQGSTPVEAVENNIEAVVVYLKACAEEGKTFEECLRRAPLRYFFMFAWRIFISGLRETLAPEKLNRSSYYKEALRLAA